MELTPLGPNKTELELPSGVRILFSYRTPVAAWIPGRGFVRTDQHWSVTTSKHINQWLGGVPAESVPQAELDLMV